MVEPNVACCHTEEQEEEPEEEEEEEEDMYFTPDALQTYELLTRTTGLNMTMENILYIALHA